MMRHDVFTRRVLTIAALLLAPRHLMATTAADLCMPSDNPCVVGTAIAVDDKSVIELGARGLHIANGGKLVVSPSTTVANATGAMTINAGPVTIDSGGSIVARGDSNMTAGGKITINAGSLTIAPPPVNSPTAPLDASGSGGGDIEIVVTGDVEIPGPIPSPAPGAIAARSLSQTADGGVINITSDTATIGGFIDLRGGGSSDASGGTLSVSTTGDLTVSGTVDASGGDNGSNLCIDLSTSAGNVTLMTATAVLRSDATVTDGSGGGVSISAGGDGVSTGFATISGLISTKGNAAGDGGDVSIDAAGNILIDQTGMIHEDAGSDGGGSELSLTSGKAITVQGLISNTAPGADSTPGDGCIEAATDLVISGMITFTGGGTLELSSDTSNVMVQASAVIDVSGDNGDICISATTDMTQTVVIDGDLMADSFMGTPAGEIDLEAQGSVRVSQSGLLHANAVGGGGNAGIFSIISDNADVSFAGQLTAEGAGPNGNGASITIQAASGVNITGPIDGKSPVAGGAVLIQSDTGPVDIASNVDVSSPGGVGGSIMATGAGDMIISGTLTTDGNTGGSISIVGCDVTLCGLDAPNCPSRSTGGLSSLGASGHNNVTGKSTTAILGNMQAGASNTLTWTGQGGGLPFVGGQIKPTAQIVVDSKLMPCQACQPPATCPSPSPFPRTPSPTATPTHGGSTPTVPPTIVPVSCTGDCDGSKSVGVSELISLVNILLGNSTVSSCQHGIPAGAQVNIALVIKAVNNLLNGCTM
jgi:hypothetical protein